MGEPGVLWPASTPIPGGSTYPEGTEWHAADRIWRVERLSHDEVLRADSLLCVLLDTMRVLAERHGDDNVRLVP
jgi:hypothetical protein